MERNMDLVREILLLSERADERVSALALSPESGTAREIAFHVELMEAHGLLGCKVVRSGSGAVAQCDVLGLTWEGYDYLDAIRSEKVWSRAKEAIGKAVGETTLSVVKDACTALASSMIKAQLGI